MRGYTARAVNAPAFPTNFWSDRTLAAYLGSDELIRTDDPVLVAKAREITRGSWIPFDTTIGETDYVDSGHIRIGVFQSVATVLNAKSFEIIEHRLGR